MNSTVANACNFHKMYQVRTIIRSNLMWYTDINFVIDTVRRIYVSEN